jgi:hypothetical protein
MFLDRVTYAYGPIPLAAKENILLAMAGKSHELMTKKGQY